MAPYQPPPIVANTSRASTSGLGALTRILDMVEAILPGVTDAIVQAEMFFTIEEFCSQSTYWRVWLDWFIPAGQPSMDMNAVYQNFVICWILGFRPPNSDGTTTLPQDFTSDFSSDFDTTSDYSPGAVTPNSFYRRLRIDPQAVIVDEYGVSSGFNRAGCALCVLKPYELSDAAVPPFISNQFAEPIRDGTLFRLYSQPNKPYSDPARAEYYGKRFRNQMIRARAAARDNNPPRHLFPYFATGRQVSSSGVSPGNWWGLEPS